MNDTLRASLTAHARELSQRVLDRMYENPFWQERYGARGRQFADEDSLFHLKYLDQALAADDAAVFEKYARWLRGILVSRGMCSEHLAENFRLLSDEIDTLGLPAASAATAILDRGARSLTYTDGPAGLLESRRHVLLAAVEQSPAAAAMREDDRRYLVSYFLDAAATQNPQLFESFAVRCPTGTVAALQQAARGPALAPTHPNGPPARD